MLSDQMKAAIIRGLYNALGTLFVVGLTALAKGANLRDAAIAGGIAAAGVLGFRAVGEGTFDTGRAIAALKGDLTAIKPSDVGAYAPPLPNPPEARQ